MLAIFFSIKTIEELCLQNVLAGCILQGGFLIYDVFWVFATDVMVTVADIPNLPMKSKFDSFKFRLIIQIVIEIILLVRLDVRISLVFFSCFPC